MKNTTLTALDAELAAAIASGDEAKVTEVAGRFEAHGLPELATVLREKGAAGVRDMLEAIGA
ncbi:hypothetical protein DMC63_37890 [Streptomyces sp. WAC 05977]|nr:hypothetical protein DMC63_37890 [Streptomyces sp. WAC 05977]